MKVTEDRSNGTTTASTRHANGRFQLGNPGGPGRPPGGKEREYKNVLLCAVTIDNWKMICDVAVRAALGGDAAARDWIGRMLFVNQPMLLLQIVKEAKARLEAIEGQWKQPAAAADGKGVLNDADS